MSQSSGSVLQGRGGRDVYTQRGGGGFVLQHSTQHVVSFPVACFLQAGRFLMIRDNSKCRFFCLRFPSDRILLAWQKNPIKESGKNPQILSIEQTLRPV